ncbi:MAG: 3-dehydroquinate synthase [Verrucomicrobiota bacterium]
MRRDFEIPLTFRHRIVFERNVFGAESEVLEELFEERGPAARVVVLMEEGLRGFFPDLAERVEAKVREVEGLKWVGIHFLAGGEQCKVDERVYEQACDEIAGAGIDRHSYVFAIGGGAFLDVVGFAAATVHRGVRLVRFPTTTLSQDDSGVGVKCGINKYGKKNFLGAFAVPFAVVNDFDFLHSQPEGQRREGLVEAVKVALVKDGSFFDWIEDHVAGLSALKPALLEEAVERSAILHAEHIALGGDPFESGSSRPLDFGHWAAHKLEQLTNFRVSHAQAVAIGLSLDVLYSVKTGRLGKEEAERILGVLAGLKLTLWDEALDWRSETGRLEVFAGLEEFREHLGGRLTILLLEGIGRGVEVNEMDDEVLERCLSELKAREAGLLASA